MSDLRSDVGRTQVSAWTTFLDELDWWIAQKGEALVPQAATSRVIAGVPYPLGQRVKNQRIRYRQGALEASRIQELEDRAGWSWSGYASRSAKIWDRRIAALHDYVSDHGSLDGLEAVDSLLSRWLRAQRDAALTSSQRRELGKIPGALEQRKVRLEEFLTAMRSWIAAEPGRDAGDVRFSTVFRIGRQVIPIGRRVAYWRSRHAAGQLDDVAAAAIAALPGWDWNSATRQPASTAVDG